jgi:hypothetical protein
LGRQEKGERLCCPFYRERERRGRVGQGGNGRRLTPLHCLMASVLRREIMGGGRNGGVEAPLTTRNRTDARCMELGQFSFGRGRNIGSGTTSVGRGRDGYSRASARGASPRARTGAGTVAVSHRRGARWREREGAWERRREMRGEERERARGERELKEGGGGWPVQNIRTRA